ncbi:hypothetical protein KL86PLE_100486 [uncultured Pleomorphomonas sp.]|uniref:Uncharacterized protein n=1 Tax=uncultured Pleomorphomonas sp. TaxID=442121 RepID=A0A212L479_9HYPH|nr:hypothetical protein KL86PLE_100486 [uncultured Pleomorphomonas sp.]
MSPLQGWPARSSVHTKVAVS